MCMARVPIHFKEHKPASVPLQMGCGCHTLKRSACACACANVYMLICFYMPSNSRVCLGKWEPKDNITLRVCLRACGWACTRVCLGKWDNAMRAWTCAWSVSVRVRVRVHVHARTCACAWRVCPYISTCSDTRMCLCKWDALCWHKISRNHRRASASSHSAVGKENNT